MIQPICSSTDSLLKKFRSKMNYYTGEENRSFDIIIDEGHVASGNLSGTQSFVSAGSSSTPSLRLHAYSPSSRYETIRRSIRYWLFDRNYMWLAVWIYVQVALYLYYFISYSYSPHYTTMRSVLGYGLPVARGAAGVLLLNCSLIFLTMCRITMTVLSRVHFIRRLMCLDAHREIHRWIAVSIVFFTVIHVGAHVFNMLHVAEKTKQSFVSLFFLSGPSWTGHVALICLMTITICSAFKKLVTARYELLAYSHYLIFPFILFLQIHGIFCSITRDDETKCDGAQMWKYSLFPIGLYLTERVYSEVMSRIKVRTHRVIKHRSNILEIQFNHRHLFGGVTYNFQPGQYLYLNCPDISKVQWHPFTITSAPEDPFVSVHIKCSGDWTTELVQRMETAYQSLAAVKSVPEGTIDMQSMLPQIYASRALFSPADQVFNYSVSLLIGCGVGITPYISILKALKKRSDHPAGPRNVKIVYFVWVCRDLDDFECLVYFLRQLEDEGLDKIVKIGLYWTLKSTRPSMCLDLHMKSMAGLDPITGLRAVTYFGRPRWKMILEKMCRIHMGEKKMGVFFCGPPALSSQLMRICSNVSTADGPRLDFYPEIF